MISIGSKVYLIREKQKPVACTVVNFEDGLYELTTDPLKYEIYVDHEKQIFLYGTATETYTKVRESSLIYSV